MAKKKKKVRSTSKRMNNANKKAYKTVSDLKAASKSAQLDTSNPFGFITDEGKILDTLNAATNAAYDVNMKEANLGLNRAEDTAYSNTQNAVNELRNSMASSTASGANRGAAGAAALQAILGLGQQNTSLVTEGMQNVQKVAGERAAALKENAASAIEQSNSARAQQATAANEKYTADQTRAAEAISALGALAGTIQTNRANRIMNDDTNKTNKKIANTTQKQQVTTINK